MWSCVLLECANIASAAWTDAQSLEKAAGGKSQFRGIVVREPAETEWIRDARAWGL